MGLSATKQMGHATLKAWQSNLGHRGEEGRGGRPPQDHRSDPPDRREYLTHAGHVWGRLILERLTGASAAPVSVSGCPVGSLPSAILCYTVVAVGELTLQSKRSPDSGRCLLHE